MTQPSGHTTSGSHERYKPSGRLEWERQFDPLKKMKEWLVENYITTEQVLGEIENSAANEAKLALKSAWANYTAPFIEEKKRLVNIINNKSCTCSNENFEKVNQLVLELAQIQYPIEKDIVSIARKIVRNICHNCPTKNNLHEDLSKLLSKCLVEGAESYSSNLYNETKKSALLVKECKPVYSANAPMVNGREILRDNFESLFHQYPLLVALGEDVGLIGGVNQTYEGLQQKFGDLRITDTGIRETTIVGQGIGLALRGFRPIAEIQYFDYLLYALQTISDDLATTHWRTRGNQIAPLIISTRGHRLEGVWHSGSPMSMLIGSVRGIHVCTPRDLTQAAGFYNTLLKADDPAIVIEPLNGYRLKELRPDNIGQYTVPLGIPEILTEGSDITLVTYGSCVRIALKAVEELHDFNISVELIDVQTMLPFDINHVILDSIKKTNRVIFFDEDLPGGATAYMMYKVLEEQKAYHYLDSQPRTLTGKEHRPAYSTDGDYFSNPNSEDVFELVYSIMHEAYPGRWKEL
jgi:pyruvate/2-oxoglutarate/acetoin dehydrogenase E1 component